MVICLKRAYEKASPSDGKRVLVERLWPRGLKKEDAKIDEWTREVAPSAALRKWYGHDASKWEQFKEKYWAELDGKRGLVSRLAEEAKGKKVTFIFASKEEKLNSAAALKEYIEKHP